MPVRKTNKGHSIDLDALLASQSETPALGNMRTNAKGDVIGKAGSVTQTNEERVRSYYEDNPSSSTHNVSLKTAHATPKPAPVADKEPSPEAKTVAPAPKPKKAPKKTVSKEAVATEISRATDKLAKVAEQRTPIGQKEVMQPNGDIEVIPIYEDEFEDKE